jgi:hypothetical protein
MAEQLLPDVIAARAWQTAAEFVQVWPELSISWADWYDSPSHLVVSSPSAVLHYAHSDGPTLESVSGEVSLTWAQVDGFDPDSVFARSTWAGNFGDPAEADHLTAKAAVYATIAGLLRYSPWTARPAKIVFATENPVDDPKAVFGLLSDFPSLMSTVKWYVSQVSVGLRRAVQGRPLGWHEPLWQIARQGVPIAVFDEAGRVHLPRVAAGDDNRADLIDLVADDADWVAGGLSFDIVGALDHLDGDIEALVALITPGARRTFGLRRAWNPSDPNKEQAQPRRLGE